jgi:hypothetical protein
VLNPTYHPGTADSAIGMVYLTLTAFENSPCVFPEVNTMSLTIIKSPQVNAGNDAVICHGTFFQIEASASDYEEILWTTSGDGYYSNPGLINPEYYPGNQDIQSGGAILYLVALPVLPCVLVDTESMELTIEQNPSVDVGSDQTICEDQTVQCTATAENYASLLWYALGGDGYFSDPAILNPVYYPGEYEKTTGVAYILLLAAPVSPCSTEGNASFRLNLINNPVVTAGTDQTLCIGDSAEINATIQNCEELIWESFGDGFFTNPTSLSTRYYPGPADIENGLVSLFPVAIPVSPCETSAKDTTMLFIEAPALVDAGPDTTVCAEATITASVVNSSSYLWITEGDGSFSNPENLNTLYYAGQQDLEDQEVLLTLLALSDEPCEQVVEDDKLLVFDQPFIVESEIQDQEILSGETILLYFEGSSMQEVTHQWYHNSQPVDNANTPGFIIENSTPLHAGNYHCVCFNNCFELISDTVLITIYDPSVQIIQIEEGWNAVSSFVQPENTNIQEILDPIIGDIIIVFNEDGVFWPEEDFQTFYNWDPNSGYIIKSSCSSSFEIQGFVKHPAEVIIITPGWSILHVNACCQANISDMFASHPEISMIKEIGGCRLYWPEKGINTLESLKPGKAYEIFNAAGTETSIVFPGCFE